MLSIQEFLKKINTSSAVRENIPMGLGMGLPVISIIKDRLLVSVFYYRCILRPNDQTLLMPPEYKITLDYPSGKLTSFENLRLDPAYAKVNFDKPVGTFRHKAIQHLGREEYKKEKEDLYEALNGLIGFLGDEGDFTREEEERLSKQYRMLAEPSFRAFYKALSPQFYQRYMQE